MSNQDKLNQLFSGENTDVKFLVANASDGTEELCGEALRVFSMLNSGELEDSKLLSLTYRDSN